MKKLQVDELYGMVMIEVGRDFIDSIFYDDVGSILEIDIFSKLTNTFPIRARAGVAQFAQVPGWVRLAMTLSSGRVRLVT